MATIKKSSKYVTTPELQKFGIDYGRHLLMQGQDDRKKESLELKVMFCEEILIIENERLSRLLLGLTQNHATMNQPTLSKSIDMIKEVRKSMDLYLRLYYFFTYKDHSFKG